MKRKLLAIFAAVVLAAPLSASALSVSFSFTNDVFGNVGGTVTGRILGLADSGTSSATQVLIDSFPAGLNSIAGTGPIDAMLWDQQYQNSFTVVNGAVVSGGFWAQQTVAGYSQGYQLYINGTAQGYNFLNLDGVDQSYVWGRNGLAAANIAPITAVPEPGTLALLGLGLVGIGFARRRRTS